MRPTIERWLAIPRPKQYCSFFGSRTLLQQTLDRAALLTWPERILTVIGSGHRPHLESAVRPGSAGRVLDQPLDRGTTAGTLLALAHVMDREPDATVMVMPSDHFARPEERFTWHLDQVLRAALYHPSRVILLGAAPDGPETDYGWLVLDAARRLHAPEGRPLPVRGYREKPDPDSAAELYRSGALWSTHLFAGKASVLWTLALRHVPEVVESFEALRGALLASRRGQRPSADLDNTLSEVYEKLPFSEFANAVFERSADQLMALRLEGVLWSDWGRPERVLKVLHDLNIPVPFEASAAPS